MKRPEPKCIQWKRQGAERVAAQTASMSREEELEFWRKKTDQLRELQIEQLKALPEQDDALYRTALDVEGDRYLSDMAADWDAIAGDGLEARRSLASQSRPDAGQ